MAVSMRGGIWLAAGAAVAVAAAVPVHADVTPYVKLPGIAACEIDTNAVVCEGNWPQAPVTPCPQCPETMHMDQAVVDANGHLSWRDANIGDPGDGPGWFVLTVGQPYQGHGWTVQMDQAGRSTFTNDATGHGLAITWVVARDASHAQLTTF